MEPLSVFKYLDYKKFLKDVVHRNRTIYGYKTRLATAARCRNSYLSQVLNADFHLAAEHALGLSDFWSFAATEKDYFVMLVNLARAGTPDLRKYYETLLKKIAAKHERQVMRSSAVEIAEDWKTLFYSSWHFTAIHDLTTFPGGQTVEALVRRLELPKDIVEDALRVLESMKLVEKRERGWQATVNELVVPPGTTHSSMHIHHWTQRAAVDSLRRKRPMESVHLSWVFGISPEDYKKLRDLIMEHIQKAQKIIPASDRKELACMNLNLFVV